MNKQDPAEIGINNVDSNVFTQLKMMASIKYEGPRWPPVRLYQSCERQHNLPLPCAQLQTHYRQEAIVALPSPRTKQREEAEVTPSVPPPPFGEMASPPDGHRDHRTRCMDDGAGVGEKQLEEQRWKLWIPEM